MSADTAAAAFGQRSRTLITARTSWVAMASAAVRMLTLLQLTVHCAQAGSGLPVIIRHPQNTYALVGHATTLYCRHTSTLDTHVTWHKDGVKVATAYDNPTSFYDVLMEGDLLILHFQLRDVGRYYCNATNHYGSAISQNATLGQAYIRDDFRRVPENLSVAAGRDAQFHCQPPPGLPQPQVKWNVKTNRRLEIWIPMPALQPGTTAVGASGMIRQGRYMMDESGSTLTVTTVQKADGGDYKCVAYNEVGERSSVSARLTVWEKPLVTEPPVDLLINQGQEAKFRCVVTGDPAPSIRWLKNTGVLDGGGGGGAAGGRRSIVMPDNSLVLRGVLPSDEGSYTCEATNDGGIAEATAYLTVNTPPRFLSRPYNKMTSTGKSVLFHCVVDGSPPPSLYWHKQADTGEHMFPRHSYSSDKFSVSEDGTLRISNVQLDDDGNYICNALNNAGHDSASATLRVREFDNQEPPVISEGPSNVTVKTSSSVVLRCRVATVDGGPLPLVLWLKNNRPLVSNMPLVTNPRFSLVDSSNLRITDVYITDTGSYTCFVISESGEATATAVLTVQGKQSSNAVQTRIPPSPGKPYATVTMDTSVTLNWESPQTSATSEWSYNVEIFSYADSQGWIQSSRWLPGQQSTTVTQLLPGTSYVFAVRARNDFGTSEASPLSDSVKTRGEALRESSLSQRLATVVSPFLTRSTVVTIKEPQVVSSSAVNVSWSLTDKAKVAPIEGFYLRISSVRGHSVDTVFSSFSTYRRVSNLHPYTLYQFSVVPFYYTVTGTPSAVIEARTLEDVPSGPPRNVRIARDNGRLLLSWDATHEEHSGGILLGYHLYFTASNRAHSQNLTVNATTLRFTVRSLRPDVAYQIGIAAFTSVGVGVTSSLQTIPASQSTGGAADGGTEWQQQQSLVDEPWFLPTVIGIIGFTLSAVLLTLVFCVCLRRRATARQAKKDIASGVITVPLPAIANTPQVYVAYQTDSSYRPTTPRTVGRASHGSSASRSLSNATMANKVDEYNLDGSESSQYHKSFYNKSADAVSTATGPYATTCILGINNTELRSSLEAGPAGGSAAAHVAAPLSQQQCPMNLGSSESSCTDNNGRPGSSSGCEQHAVGCMLHGCGGLASGGTGGSASSGSGRGIKATRDSPPGLPHFADILPPPPCYPPPHGATAGADGNFAATLRQQNAPVVAPLYHQHSAPTLHNHCHGLPPVPQQQRGLPHPSSVVYCRNCSAVGYPVAGLSTSAAHADSSGGSSASSSRRNAAPVSHLAQCTHQHPSVARTTFGDYASCRDTCAHLYSTYGSQRSGGSSGRSCHDYAEPEFFESLQLAAADAAVNRGAAAGACSCCSVHRHLAAVPQCQASHDVVGWDKAMCCPTCENAEYEEPWGDNPWSLHWNPDPRLQEPLLPAAGGNAVPAGGSSSSILRQLSVSSAGGRSAQRVEQTMLDEADEDLEMTGALGNNDVVEETHSSDELSSSSEDGDALRKAEGKGLKNRMKKRARERQRGAGPTGSVVAGRPPSPYAGYSTDSSFVFVPRKPYPKTARKKQIQHKLLPAQCICFPEPGGRKDLCVQLENDEVTDRV